MRGTGGCFALRTLDENLSPPKEASPRSAKSPFLMQLARVERPPAKQQTVGTSAQSPYRTRAGLDWEFRG